MKFEEFVEKFIAIAAHDTEMYPGWKEEVLRIARGHDVDHSAKTRKVTKAAIKMQRKKIFKALRTRDSHKLVVQMLAAAVVAIQE